MVLINFSSLIGLIGSSEGQRCRVVLCRTLAVWKTRKFECWRLWDTTNPFGNRAVQLKESWPKAATWVC